MLTLALSIIPTEPRHTIRF